MAVLDKSPSGLRGDQHIALENPNAEAPSPQEQHSQEMLAAEYIEQAPRVPTLKAGIRTWRQWRPDRKRQPWAPEQHKPVREAAVRSGIASQRRVRRRRILGQQARKRCSRRGDEGQRSVRGFQSVQQHQQALGPWLL